MPCQEVRPYLVRKREDLEVPFPHSSFSILLSSPQIPSSITLAAASCHHAEDHIVLTLSWRMRMELDILQCEVPTRQQTSLLLILVASLVVTFRHVLLKVALQKTSFLASREENVLVWRSLKIPFCYYKTQTLESNRCLSVNRVYFINYSRKLIYIRTSQRACPGGRLGSMSGFPKRDQNCREICVSLSQMCSWSSKIRKRLPGEARCSCLCRLFYEIFLIGENKCLLSACET